MTWGHSSQYREWHYERVKEVYGEVAVDAWIASMPLKPENIKKVKDGSNT
jgi:hypothetical protein